MTNPQTDALEPCPFCGGKANGTIIMKFGAVQCDDCGYIIDRNSPIDAVIAWNTRPAEDSLKARIAELEAVQEVNEADLDSKMAAAGMIPLTQLLSKPPTPFLVHAAVHTMDDFYWWIAMKHKEFLMMRMRYEVGDKDKGDDLYEWVFAHSAVFGAIHDHLRESMPLPPTPVKE